MYLYYITSRRIHINIFPSRIGYSSILITGGLFDLEKNGNRLVLHRTRHLDHFSRRISL